MKARAAAPAAAPTVADLRHGGEALLTELVDRWYGPSVRLARALGADEATAHRAAQDGWLGVIAKLPELDGEKSLHLVVLHETLEKLAAGPTTPAELRPVVPADSFEAEGHRWAGWWRDASAPTAWKDRPGDGAIARALDELDPAVAAMVMLHDVEGLSPDEIEDVSGLAPAQQRRLLHHGRLAIVRALATTRVAGT
jgi:hypothetical protein